MGRHKTHIGLSVNQKEPFTGRALAGISGSEKTAVLKMGVKAFCSITGLSLSNICSLRENHTLRKQKANTALEHRNAALSGILNPIGRASCRLILVHLL